MKERQSADNRADPERARGHGWHAAADGGHAPAAVTGRDSWANGLLVATAVGVAWFPAETHEFVPVGLAAVVVALSTWGWRRSTAEVIRCLWLAVSVCAVLLLSGLAGLDPSRAVGGVGLGLAITGLVWLASRCRPRRNLIGVFAFGLAALAAWGIWQSVIGHGSTAAELGTVPEAFRAYVEERLADGRAHASLPLPSHLAVVLATVLPLLVARIRSSLFGWAAAGAALVALAGIVATRSPVGTALAVAAVAAVVLGRSRVQLVGLGVAAVLLLAALVVVRGDVRRLEPVSLRVENWRTALWVTGTSPVSGVGFSSFAQASQALPFAVGNRPAHAHNAPLETLAELGPIGLGGLVGLFWWLLRRTIDLWHRDRALAAAIWVVPLHNLVDFSVFISGVVVPWAVLVGWAFAREDVAVVSNERSWDRTAFVGCAAVVLAVTTLHATSLVVERAAASRSDPAERFRGAVRSIQLAPWRAPPQFLLAAAALESGESELLDRAAIEMEHRRWFRPRSAALAERRARVGLARGDASVAVSELWSAVALGSPDPRRRRDLDALVSTLEGSTAP